MTPFVPVLYCLGACASMSMTSLEPAGPPAGAVGNWRFSQDEFFGGVIEDRAGDAPLELEKGGLLFAGDGEAECLLLDDRARRLVISEAFDPGSLPRDALTLEAWVRIDAFVDWAGILSAIEDNGEYERGWVFGCHGDRFFFGLATGPAPPKVTYLFAPEPVIAGSWHHLAATYNGREMRLIVDGEVVARSFDRSGEIAYPDSLIYTIGAYQDSNERHALIGRIHEISLFDHARPVADLLAAHASRRPLLPRLLDLDDEANLDSHPSIVGWPTYMHDARRSGVTDEVLQFPLHPAWTHVASAAPRPSWPDPARRTFWQKIPSLTPRVVFDECFHPVAAGNWAYYASSVDDQVHCLDLASGKRIWAFTADAPVRFAPVISGDRLFFAADDGIVYCLDRRSGDLIWQTMIAPEVRRIPGNGRMISAWPPRTGLVVDRGRVFCCSGLFPSQGTWCTQLAASDGTTMWRVPLAGISPQGYLLATNSRLYVPTGRTSPVLLDRRTGRRHGSFTGPGGSYALLIDNSLVSGPGNTGQLQESNARSRDRIASFDADRGIVTHARCFLQHRGRIRAIDRVAYRELTAHRVELQSELAALQAAEARGEGVGDAHHLAARELDDVTDQLPRCELWNIEAGETDSLILAGDHLIAGGDGRIAAYDIHSGNQTWAAPVDGRARGLAVVHGQLLVATDTGTLHCFAPGKRSTVPVPSTPAMIPERVGSAFAELLNMPVTPAVTAARRAGMHRGFALVVDPVDGSDARILANRTDLQVLLIADSIEQRDALRATLIDDGLYGTAITVQYHENDLPFADAFANVVLSERSLQGKGSAHRVQRWMRCLRPAGGVAIAGLQDRPILATAGEFFQLEDLSTRSIAVFRRDALPGSDDWSHPMADTGHSSASRDSRINGDLQLQWFGGPGPGRMVDRHLRTAPALERSGRLFIPAHDEIIAVDAYNGTELWSLPLPGFTRTGVPYDGGYWAAGSESLYATAGDRLMVIDPVTGMIRYRAGLPRSVLRGHAPGTAEWGILMLTENLIIGSAQQVGASRREHSREEVSDQYGEYLPLVTGHTLFALDRHTRRPVWVHQQGVFPSASVAVEGDTVLLLECRNPSALEDEDGRVTLDSLTEGGGLVLVALDLQTGAPAWKQPLADSVHLEHSVFLTARDGVVIVSGSATSDNQTWYHLAAFDTADGEELWNASHPNNRAGARGTHGEQVHHPIIIGDTLIAEPRAYQLRTGSPAQPVAGMGDFYLQTRRGCGTLTGSRSCLFFRDDSPSLVELSSSGVTRKITEVTRPGCWINIIPAAGLVLLPESSAGCVCGYSLQTSMAFIPRNPNPPPLPQEGTP